MQTALDFTTSSPINIARLTGQNKRLYEYMIAGGKIHVLHPAKKKLKIGYLNSRASDFINKYDVPVRKRRIKAKDVDGNMVDVVEYSMPP